MKILVTGASGHLGRLVVDALLERGVPASDLVATARDPQALSDLADLGVDTPRLDYDDPQSAKDALAGVDRVLLVSGSDVGDRVRQHRAVIDAAVEHDVELLAYTSILRADTTELGLATEHAATEQLIRESGLPAAYLRNSWYVENYTAQLPVALAQGGFAGAAGDGRISAATRADYAAAAAVVLSTDGHAGQAYELGGDGAFTMAELAAVVAEETGRDVGYTDLPEAEFATLLEGAGLPAPYAAALAAADTGIKRGDLLETSGTLSRLIGRPTTSLREAVRAAL
jgi:NAD(P)H dehydrogenase (quinone)